MRNLIRLFLLTIARMALLVTMLVWIMSNWLAIWSSAGDLGGVIVQRHGWVVVIPGSSVWGLQVVDVQNLDWADPLFAGTTEDDPLNVARILPGLYASIEITPTGKMSVAIGIRHWLATSVAVLFYVALKLIYRRRTVIPDTKVTQ